VYIGHTDNLELRLAQHRSRTYDGYTAKRLPVRLVYSDWFRTRDEAFEAEHKLKKWTRAKKLALASGNIDLLKQLARRRTATHLPIRRETQPPAPPRPG
jgi:predicted GIY-YIG superfamily endonuclease